MEFETRVLRALILVVLVAGTLLGVGPMRRWCTAHPAWVLAAIVAFDVGWLLHVHVPFVVSGYDEAQFLVDAHRMHGADLPVSWIRTPFPVLAIAASPAVPGLPGIVAKQLATLATFLLVRRPLGVGMALFAALLASCAEEMVASCCEARSEPFGAAALTCFALAVARGGPVGLFVTATLGAMSRWQMLWLLPVASVLVWRRHGWRSATAGVLCAACVFAFGVWLTDVDPLRAFLQERQRDHSIGERLWFYLSPKCGLGLGPAGYCLLLLGVVALVRERPRSALLACAAIFFVYAAGVVSIGVIVPRFFAPAVPLACVLAVRGVASLQRRWPALTAQWPAAIGAALLVAASAIPVHQPRTRERTLSSPQAPIALDRAAVLAALGDAVPYSDVDAQKVRAILGRRCIAVGDAHTETDDGKVERARIPAGSLYFTFESSGRAPLWSSGRLSLVRW